MMKPHFAMFILPLALVVSSDRPVAETAIFTYVSQYGEGYRKIDLAENVAYNVSSISEKINFKNWKGLEFVDEIKYCNVADILCLQIGPVYFSSPPVDCSVKSWWVNDIKFTTVAQSRRIDDLVRVIAVRFRGEIYSSYVFSEKYGIEAMTLQAGGDPPYESTTFFLAGEYGLLRRVATKQYSHCDM